jgi:M6 family metalloprotease-like protein
MLMLAVLVVPACGQAVSSLAPGFPGKKGLSFVEEKHGFQPRLLQERLPEQGLFGLSWIEPRTDTATIRLLALFVEFPDVQFIQERLFVERHLLFLSQYFSNVSGGLLQIEIFTSDSVFVVPRPMAYYGQDDDIGLRLVELAVDAVTASDSVIDFSSYDELFIVHAGLGQEADVLGNSPEQIWSASLGPAEFEYYLPDTLGRVGIATNDTLLDGTQKYIQQLVVVPEDETQDGWTFSPLGVFVHEFGHLLELPDLYDTEPSGNSDSQGIGNWGLMGTGLWNGNGFIPAEPCAWTKAVMGWKAVRVLSTPGTGNLSFSAGKNPEGEIALVPLGGREYFLLENRLQDYDGNGFFGFDDADSNGSFDIYVDSYDGAEFDFFLPGFGTGSGLLIWHVDEQQIEARAPYNKVNADQYHKGVDLEEADGIEDLDVPASALESYGSRYDSFREGNNASFTPTSLPNTDGSYGGESFVYVENVGPPGQLMSFGVDFGQRSGPWPVAAGSSFGANHPNLADLNGDEIPEIIACDSGGFLYVLNADGTAYPGSGTGSEPAKSLGGSVLSSPAVGDIDDDGLPEIVVVSAGGNVYAWNGEDLSEVRDGDENPLTNGVLTELSPAGETEVVLSDFDGVGGDDIIFGSSIPDTTIEPSPGVINALGTAAADSFYVLYLVTVAPDSVKTLRVVFDVPVDRAVVVTDFDGGGVKDMVFSTGSGNGDGTLNIWRLSFCILQQSLVYCFCDGCGLSGVDTEFTEIIAGDVDEDGLPELLAADIAGKVHAFDVIIDPDLIDFLVEPGVLLELPGWPVALVDSQLAGLSFGEIDGDGRFEVLAASAGRAFAINYNGTILPGWPPKIETRPYGFGRVHGPLSADVSGDGSAEFVGTIGDSRLVAMGADGRTLDGWPIVAGSLSGASPILADVDGNGFIELVVLRDVGVGDSLRGEIDLIELGVPFDAGVAWWPSYRRDSSHSGVMPDSVTAPAPAVGRLVKDLYAMPNPARGASAQLHYTLSEGVDRVTLEIYDLSGKSVHSASPAAFAASDNVYTFSLGAFAPGVYILRLEATGGNGASERAFSKLAILR